MVLLGGGDGENGVDVTPGWKAVGVGLTRDPIGPNAPLSLLRTQNYSLSIPEKNDKNLNKTYCGTNFIKNPVN